MTDSVTALIGVTVSSVTKIMENKQRECLVLSLIIIPGCLGISFPLGFLCPKRYQYLEGEDEEEETGIE